MFDLITLSLLWLFTAGVSGLFWLLKLWPGGIYWFWAWNTVSLSIALWELFIYLKYKMTLTRLLTKSGTDKPMVAKHKTIAKVVIFSYFLGIVSLCVHLWPW